MQKYFLLPLAFLLLVLSGCSIQVGGLNNAYRSPSTVNASDAAVLKVSSNNVTVTSIDSKSINNAQSVALTPGIHEITLYLGENNYISDVNNLVVLSASFKANKVYFLKATENKVWIEDSQGFKVSSIRSNMKFNKSTTL